MFWRLPLHVAAALVLMAAGATPQPRFDPALELARARDPGIVTLLRHARAPGVGDPPNFSLDDCATQRNLSDEGRDDARRLGAAFRAVGVRDADVRSSEWCRCLETARLLALGPVRTATYLNSFFAGRGDEQPRRGRFAGRSSRKSTPAPRRSSSPTRSTSRRSPASCPPRPKPSSCAPPQPGPSPSSAGRAYPEGSPCHPSTSPASS